MDLEAVLKEQVGALVRAHRKAAKLTQAELAERSGVTQSEISYAERGERLPTLPRLAVLAHALGVGLRELVPEMKGNDLDRSTEAHT